MGSTSIAASPVLLDSQPYSYVQTVQNVDEEDEINRPIWVSVQDISDALEHKVKVTDEISF